MKRVIPLAALALLAGGVVEAACVQRVAVKQQVVKQDVVLAAPLVLAQSYSPSYGVQYNPSGQGQQDDLMRRLIEVLERLEAKVDGGGAAAGLAERFPFAEVAQQACAACHTGAAAKKGFAIFDDGGKLLLEGRGDRAAVYSRVFTKDAAMRMPPGKALNAGALAGIKAWTEQKPAPAFAPKKD